MGVPCRRRCSPLPSSRRMRKRTCRALWPACSSPTRSWFWIRPRPTARSRSRARSTRRSTTSRGRASRARRIPRSQSARARGFCRSMPTRSLAPSCRNRSRRCCRRNPPTDAFYIRRRNLFLGRWIKHGGFYPDPKLRLFRRTAANFTYARRSFEEPPRARDHRLRRRGLDARLRPHPPRVPDARNLHRAHGPLQHPGLQAACVARAR